MITGAVTGFVNNWPEQTSASLSDIRREAAEHTNEIVKEGLKGTYETRGDIKDARFDVASRVDGQGDRITDRLQEHDAKVADRFFAIGRDTADLRAQVVAQQQQLVAGFGAVAKDNEIAVLKNTIEGKNNTQYLADKIVDDGEKTRALINDLKYNDLNRALVERNAELVEERHYGRHWRHYADQSQWVALNSQLQAFQSQLQETRQGMVNFGTMAGVGQSSTSNNVR